MLRLITLLGLLAVTLAAPAAQTSNATPYVVMNLAAHPDDEDGLTLAYYRHAKDAVAYSVIYTRGEGGQNEIGPELYERLGAIRSRETLAAAQVLGTQVFFLNFYDFGFSKSATETFREWSRPRRGFWDTDVPTVSESAGRDTVTARLVYLIRTLKPDIVFTNHDTTTVWPGAQHGHHQAVGISAWDAFEKAADPTYHPEQLEQAGVDLWQPQRLFRRHYGKPSEWDAAVPVGDRCPTGRPFQAPPTCADLAVQAAAQHRSQGFDKFADRFRRDTTHFSLYRSATGTPPLPPGAEDLAAGLNLTPRPPLPDYALAGGWQRPKRNAPIVHVQAAEGVRAYADGTLLAVPGEDVTLKVMGLPLGRDRVAIHLSGAIDTTLVAQGEPAVVRFRVPSGITPQLPRYRFQYDRLSDEPPLPVRHRGAPRLAPYRRAPSRHR